ncbi:hypothetical protein BB561_000251 [Smittium simulii]|uniref:Glucose-6-phosphate 1-dehydrogenase n=1 Tax=Smittium simulii TaxID=133385 RepID=A0A2T9Z015_9FUNG|nr:hypothetical protein BB561_000251 [Smittium simulii]
MSVFETNPVFAEKQDLTTIVVFGASGDLAKKKTFPALFQLFKNNLLPKHTRVVGYARTVMEHQDFVKKASSFIKDSQEKIDEFFKICSYVNGSYSQSEDFVRLRLKIEQGEADMKTEKVFYTSEKDICGRIIKNKLRVYYMALPPSVFISVSEKIKENVYDANVINHLVIEKPFGLDRESCKYLIDNIGKNFTESEVFRTDHYLGKEMVKNIIVLRFANKFYESVWNKDHIDNIQITFKEPFGTEGRGGYFDQYGIIRDVVQNHLAQVLSILAMECPKSLDAEDIRDSKAEVLRHIPPVTLDETLLGQYVKSTDGTKPGYLDDETVSKDSNTPTYASMVMHVDTDRWRGVPFIIKAAKAVETAKVVVRIQFKDVSTNLFPNISRNELVIQISPKESIYLKTVVKEPGLSNKIIMSSLELEYRDVFTKNIIPDPYAALLLDVIGNDHSNFVREDELDEAWRIFTPLLNSIDQGKIKPLPYPYGSRGPEGGDKFNAKFGGYVPTNLDYYWSENNEPLKKNNPQNKL